jgi:hypothetical protein
MIDPSSHLYAGSEKVGVCTVEGVVGVGGVGWVVKAVVGIGGVEGIAGGGLDHLHGGLGRCDGLSPPPAAVLLQLIEDGTVRHHQHRHLVTLHRSVPSGQKENHLLTTARKKDLQLEVKAVTKNRKYFQANT